MTNPFVILNASEGSVYNHFMYTDSSLRLRMTNYTIILSGGHFPDNMQDVLYSGINMHPYGEKIESR